MDKHKSQDSLRVYRPLDTAPFLFFSKV